MAESVGKLRRQSDMNLSSLCRFVVFIGSFTPADFGYNLAFYVAAWLAVYGPVN